MPEIKKQPFKLYNQIQNYDWGSKNEKAFIPKLLNIDVEEDKPYAELWIGAHPKAPSKIMVKDQLISLIDAIENYPSEILGDYVVDKFGKQLPFLFKILSADQALSIQMHPNKKQAEILHSRDPKNYPDDNHKPEIAIALDHLDALVGLKTMSEIREIIKNYNGFEKFLEQDLFDEIMRFNDVNDSEIKRNFYQQVMKAGENEIKLNQLLTELESQIETKNNKELFEKYFIENKNIFGNDVGLLSFFFYNLISLDKDEGIFTDAGVPHAYLKGNIIECMANSDNVIRAGLTPKYKDVESLLSYIDFERNNPEIMTPQGKQKIFSTSVSEFELIMSNIEFEEELNFTTSNRVQIGFVLDGEITITTDESSPRYSYGKGESFLIPALITDYKIFACKNSTVVLSVVP